MSTNYSRHSQNDLTKIKMLFNWGFKLQKATEAYPTWLYWLCTAYYDGSQRPRWHNQIPVISLNHFYDISHTCKLNHLPFRTDDGLKLPFWNASFPKANTAGLLLNDQQTQLDVLRRNCRTVQQREPTSNAKITEWDREQHDTAEPGQWRHSTVQLSI